MSPFTRTNKARIFTPADFQQHAKEKVAEIYNVKNPQGNFQPEEFYVVWFCKTLQNWKALISTDVEDGVYIEVTHNGDKDETYVDVYEKVLNVEVSQVPAADPYTEPCNGTCGFPEPHSHHLTDAGRKHYIGEDPTDPVPENTLITHADQYPWAEKSE